MTAEVEAPPTFSVIMIFHNEQRFLGEAVRSVASQTGPTWELIMVDDGSTDASGDIARNLAASFPQWMRYTSHPGRVNRGMSASRNLGLGRARGEYVTFIDADDCWLPGKLESQLAALEAHPEVRVLASPAQWWSSWDDGADEADWVQRLGRFDGATESEQTTLLSPPTLLCRFLADEWQSICDLVVHRDIAIGVGGYETSFAGMFEDQVFHTKVLSQEQVVVTRDWWYRYRQHDQACTSSAHATGEHSRARRRFLRWAIAHLRAMTKPPMAGQKEWDELIDLVTTMRRRSMIPSRPRLRRRLRRR